MIVTLLFGCMLYVGTVAVDTLNKLLMLGLILSYLSLVGWGSPHVDTNLLKYENWSASFLAVPAMIISFGFHNLVPTISHYLERNEKILVKVFFIGSALPLLLYITWEWLILGLVPAEGVNSFAQSLSEGEMATHAIKNACKQPCVVHLAHTFAFFALITSFLGVALSFVDFLADGFKIEKTPKGKFILCQLVLIPPLLFSLFYPTLFLTALGYAGGYGAILLFGILPIAMVWAGRYNQKRNSKLVFPGGKLVLIILAIISGSIIILKTLQDLQ